MGSEATWEDSWGSQLTRSEWFAHWGNYPIGRPDVFGEGGRWTDWNGQEYVHVSKYVPDSMFLKVWDRAVKDWKPMFGDFSKDIEEGELPDTFEPKDSVNNPGHYTTGKFEVIEVIEDAEVGFHLGNVLKYILRSEHKHDSPLEDLKKARWYLDRHIANLEDV